MRASRLQKKSDATDNHVGARVRMRRLMLGLSQTQLADSVGITFQQVQKYEKGVNRVSASRLQQFAKILNVTVSFFFEGAPSPNVAGSRAPKSATPDYINAFLTSRDGHKIIRAFSKIENPKTRQSIVALLEGLAGR